MDGTSELALARLIRGTRLAALGTIHNGEPNLAMMAIAVEDDFSAFYIHVSRLGKHTGDMEKDPHVSLLLTEADDGRTDPQTLARLSIQGMAELIAHQDPGFPRIKDLYLKRFPDSERLFGFGDFNVWRITPISGRLVAGFGRAFNIAPETLQKASML